MKTFHHINPTTDKNILLGSDKYLNKMNTLNETKGCMYTIYKMMEDFNHLNAQQVHAFKYDFDAYFDRFCLYFNQLVTSLDIVRFVPMKSSSRHRPIYEKTIIKEFEPIHYFRNQLNKVPKTIKDLIKEKQLWELLPVEKAAFHMNGEDGIFNLKFVSTLDQRFEGVYNQQGVLLTEHNDPINMGTYNYAGPNEAKKHNLYDVQPFYVWNNTPLLKGMGSTLELARAGTNITLFYTHPKAIQHYEYYEAIMK